MNHDVPERQRCVKAGQVWRVENDAFGFVALVVDDGVLDPDSEIFVAVQQPFYVFTCAFLWVKGYGEVDVGTLTPYWVNCDDNWRRVT